MTIYNPLSTSLAKNIQSDVAEWDATGQINSRQVTAIYDSSSAISGLTLGTNVGNTTGTATLYGLK